MSIAGFVILLGACGGTRPSRPASLPLRRLADLRLPGAPSRFDYQDIDPVRRRLVIAHLGAGRIDIVDVDELRLVATIEGINAVHGVRVAADRGLIYASAKGATRVFTIDEAKKKFEVDPKMNVPDAATIEPTINNRRAPHESTRTPVGICIATYV